LLDIAARYSGQRDTKDMERCRRDKVTYNTGAGCGISQKYARRRGEGLSLDIM